ncbi:hypothetical protein PV04_10092 [Phialophora macrospora]|uniref:Carbonic anhydrase n=1 Tax=Phialophora macrospora TaxID=1851006 RepID=A0A0D2FT37_9EURO|nr:hypothetical protein PV04_10092 [Phialophora macrospora]
MMELMATSPPARACVMRLGARPLSSLRRLAPCSNLARDPTWLLHTRSATSSACQPEGEAEAASGPGATFCTPRFRPPLRSPTPSPGRQHRRSVTEISLQTPTIRLSSSPSSALTPPALSPASAAPSTRSEYRPFSTTAPPRCCKRHAEELDGSEKQHPRQPAEEDSLGAMPSAESTSPDRDAYAKAFNNNSLWRRSLAEHDPELFESMAKGQSPQILWIGCADSRCPETTILGLNPGEIFCHRNIANILVNTDINSLSVIQYAVQYLKVKHIIICGHTSCGGIAAALGNKKLGLIDTWLMPLRTLRQDNLSLLDSLDEVQRGLKMVELNVRAGVKVLLANPIVIDAMHERGLQVHGLIYNVGTGELRELDIEEDEDVVKSRVTAFKTED